MKAVILAGGKGTRLRPLTSELPKPMVPIMNVPVMEHIIRLLRDHGITEICVTLMFMPRKIRDYFQDGSRFGVSLEYFTEESPRGTAGGLLACRPFLTEPFIVISGDCMTDFNLDQAFRFHEIHHPVATILTTRVNVPLDFGVVLTNERNHVTGFLEKPTWGEVFSDTINTGIYVLDPSIYDWIPEKGFSDFSKDVFPQLVKHPGKICGCALDGYWSDIGSLDSYIRTHKDIFRGKLHIQYTRPPASPGIHIGENTTIDKSAVLHSPCFIGNNCHIGPNVVVNEMTVMGDECTLEEDTSVNRCILWSGCHIDYGCELRGVVAGHRVHMMHHAMAFENSIIGDDTLIRERAFIKPNIKIWPKKIIDAHSIVDRSVIWASRHSSSLFGREGLTGIINVDITPEFACRLGAAYGSFVKPNAAIMVSMDNSSVSRLFRHAFVSGLMSTGVRVYDIAALFQPIARHAIPLLGLDGGVHVMQDSDSCERIHALIMDRTGGDAGKAIEKNIESIFFKEEFHRCSASGITKLEEVSNFPEYYSRHLANLTQRDLISAAAPKLRLASTNPELVAFLEKLMISVGCTVEQSMVTDRFSPYLLMQEEPVEGICLSAYIDAHARQLTLMDETGQQVPEESLFLLTSQILFRTNPSAILKVPVDRSSALENMALKYGGQVERTKTDRALIMRSLIENKAFGTAFNQYTLQFDPIASLLRIVEYLSANNLTLSALLTELPRVHLEQVSLHCPWETIGRVMRRLIRLSDPDDVQLIDGVRISVPGGWVLVLPDTAEPMLHVHAEHQDELNTQMLLAKYVDIVEQLIDSLEE